jgi:hypothetical protein
MPTTKSRARGPPINESTYEGVKNAKMLSALSAYPSAKITKAIQKALEAKGGNRTMPILLKHACIHETFWGVVRLTVCVCVEMESGLYAVSFAEFLRGGGG